VPWFSKQFSSQPASTRNHDKPYLIVPTACGKDRRLLHGLFQPRSPSDFADLLRNKLHVDLRLIHFGSFVLFAGFLCMELFPFVKVRQER
jgi:hypothetical protein